MWNVAPPHVENICSWGFTHLQTGTLFANLLAENRFVDHVGIKACPFCPHIRTILHLFQVLSLISISSRSTFISNSFRKIPTSNLVLYHWAIMSWHIFVQLLYLDSVPWIKFIIQRIGNFPFPLYICNIEVTSSLQVYNLPSRNLKMFHNREFNFKALVWMRCSTCYFSLLHIEWSYSKERLHRRSDRSSLM